MPKPSSHETGKLVQNFLSGKDAASLPDERDALLSAGWQKAVARPDPETIPGVVPQHVRELMDAAKDLKATISRQKESLDELNKDCAAAEAENKRLREALEEIRKFHFPVSKEKWIQIHLIARKALEVQHERSGA